MYRITCLLILWIQFMAVFCERQVPARTDICNRLPEFSGCPRSASGSEQRAPAPAPAAPPAAAAAPAPSPADTTAAPAGTTAAAPAGSTTQSPEVQKLCAQYAGLAQQYCVGPPNELPMAKEKCNYWRKYCSKLPAATQSPLGGPPCAPYEMQ